MFKCWRSLPDGQTNAVILIWEQETSILRVHTTHLAESEVAQWLLMNWAAYARIGPIGIPAVHPEVVREEGAVPSSASGAQDEHIVTKPSKRWTSGHLQTGPGIEVSPAQSEINEPTTMAHDQENQQAHDHDQENQQDVILSDEDDEEHPW